MPRYVIECNNTHHEVESPYGEVEVIRDFIFNNSHGLFNEAPEPHYKGWKKLEIYINFNVCDECMEPSPEVAICASCVEQARLDAEEEDED